MKIFIDFDPRLNLVSIAPIETNEWHWNIITSTLYEKTVGLTQDGDRILMPINRFVEVRGLLANYAVSHGIRIKLSDHIVSFLQAANEQSYNTAIHKAPLTEEYVKETLLARGFKRTLTNNQLNNLCKIGPLPAGATFSVPGAGKTTEALAYYFLNSNPNEKLLVVAPKNAFGAWDEQLYDCLEDESLSFVRLRGGENAIRQALRNNPRFSIITYQQFPRVSDLINDFLDRNEVYMFLDESHRIKSGKSGISADSILRSAFLPKRKLIMSGTPMPQSIRDLIPQY